MSSASLSGKLDVEVEIKSKPEEFWEAIRDSHNILPKAFPKQYKSVEILEGDGKSVGSIRLVKYADGFPFVTMSKEKIEEVDEANKTVAYSVIDGEVLQFFKSFKATLVVTPKGEGSLIKWCTEYEKANEDVPDPDLIQELATNNLKGLDAYLSKASE